MGTRITLDKDILDQCQGSVMEGLETHKMFQPENKQPIKPGEALAKIWMCPSSELATVLFSEKPLPIQQAVSFNVIDELRKTGLEIFDDDLDSDETDSDESERASMSIKLNLEDVAIRELEPTSGGDNKSESEANLAVYQNQIDENLDAPGIASSAISNYENKLKELYSRQLSTGANLLKNYSLKALEDKLCQLILDIREKDKKRIDSELKVISHFIEKFTKSINAENGKKMLKKYKKKRRNAISIMIDTAEENFDSMCIVVDSELRNQFLFKSEKIKSQLEVDFLDKLKYESQNLMEKCQEEKDKIMEDHNNNIKALRDKYHRLTCDLHEEEKKHVQKHLEQVLSDKAKKDKTRELALSKLEMSNYQKASDDSAWLCILQHLLKDMKEFLKQYVSSERDVKQILKEAKKKLMTPQITGSTSIHDGNSLATLSKEQIKQLSPLTEQSIDTIPCIRGRDETLHRHLIQEAVAILENIMKDVYETTASKEDKSASPKLDKLTVGTSDKSGALIFDTSAANEVESKPIKE